MSQPVYSPLCAKCLQPLTATWPPQKHECSVVPVGPTLTCIPSDELDRLRAEVASLQGRLDARIEQLHESESYGFRLTQQLAAANGRVEMLSEAIQQTLDENRHLADGDICTLILLKRAIRKSEG